jgi:hypothetical protein
MSNHENERLMNENYNLYMRSLNNQNSNNEETYYNDNLDNGNYQIKNNNFLENNEAGQRNEYEELKNAYMKHIMSEKHMNYNHEKSYNLPYNQFKTIENNSHINSINQSPVYNQILNSQVYNRRPLSEKNPDREFKRKQQEEYRKFLDQQLQEQNEKKQRLKLEKKGIISPDANKSTNPVKINESNFTYSTYNNYNHNHVNNSGHTTPKMNLNPEKEVEKKKKMDYHNELLRQIEEQKKIKEEEKKKRLEAELRFEERYNPNLADQGAKNRGRKRKIENNYDSNLYNAMNSLNPTTLIHEPEIPEQQDSNKSNNYQKFHAAQGGYSSPSSDPHLSGEYLSFKENLNKKNTPSVNYNYHYTHNNKNIPEKENIPSNLNNIQQNRIEINDHQGYFKSVPNNLPDYEYSQPNQPFPPSGNIFQPQTARNFTQMPSIIPLVFEDMLKFFFNEQVKVINEYKSTLDRISEERDKAIFQNLASREKMIAINQLKLEQERFKNNAGFYPFDNNYNKNIEDMFNTMIENNFSKTNHDLMQNYNLNSKLKTPNISKPPEEERPISGMKENPYIKMKEETDVDYYDFRSKYEDLSKSKMSFMPEEENSQVHDFKVSSKLVCIDNKVNDSGAFLKTWRHNTFIQEEELECKPRKNNNLHKAKSMIVPDEINNRSNVFHSHRQYAQMMISKEEKDKSLVLEEYENEKLNQEEHFEQTCKDYMESINVDYPDEEVKYNPDFKSNDSDSKYSDTFHENEIEDLKVENIPEVNLEDFKEIHENQKLQTKVNFFENSEDNYEIKKNDIKHVVSGEDKIKIPTATKLDPKDRIPRDITANNISKINDIYNKYTNLQKQNLNNIANDEDTQFMESINNFNNNLRNERDQIKQQFSHYQATNEDSSSNGQGKTLQTEINQKHNPLDEVNNEDSIIKDLTKFTKFALNEIDQSQ